VGLLEPSPVTVHRIGLLFGGLPGVLILVAAALILRYSLTRTRVLDIQSALGRRDGPPALQSEGGRRDAE
jgi:Na+/melibiose symporter-like transporter